MQQHDNATMQRYNHALPTCKIWEVCWTAGFVIIQLASPMKQTAQTHLVGMIMEIFDATSLSVSSKTVRNCLLPSNGHTPLMHLCDTTAGRQKIPKFGTVLDMPNIQHTLANIYKMLTNFEKTIVPQKACLFAKQKKKRLRPPVQP